MGATCPYRRTLLSNSDFNRPDDRFICWHTNTSKHLIYYQWNGEQWYKRLLYRLNPIEDISCLEILCTLNKVHILYYIENALKEHRNL